jgi:hypothetical protein
MSLSDLVRSADDASAVGHAMLLAQALLDGPQDFGPRSFCYTTAVREDSYRNVPPYGAAFGVGGVGVVRIGSRLHAAILELPRVTDLVTEPQLMEHAIEPLTEKSKIHAAVAMVIRDGVKALADTMVIHISEPEFQAAPGDTVQSALTGTAGAQLNWGPGLDGILTAGHVGNPSGSGATAGGTGGNVALSLNPTNHGKTPEADVAVIQLSAAVPAANRIATSTTANPGDSVSVLLRKGGPATTMIMGQLQWLWMPKPNCTCGHVYMTTTCVTKKGDSGAPVLKGSSLIGHVIGASVGMTTYIQLFGYQLQEIANRSGFSSAKL